MHFLLWASVFQALLWALADPLSYNPYGEEDVRLLVRFAFVSVVSAILRYLWGSIWGSGRRIGARFAEAIFTGMATAGLLSFFSNSLSGPLIGRDFFLAILGAVIGLEGLVRIYEVIRDRKITGGADGKP